MLVRRAAIAVTIEGGKIALCRHRGQLTRSRFPIPGNAPAENVRVFAELPPDAKFASATQGGQWKADQGKVLWTLSTLRPGEELVLELRCTLASPGANKLQVMSTAAGDLNDMADIVTNVEALADLKLEVSEPAGPVAVGDEMVYELHVRNRGTKTAESVSVVAYFSDGIEPTSAEGGTHDIANGVVAFRPLASLPVGGEVVYHIRARAQKVRQANLPHGSRLRQAGHEACQRRRGHDLSERWRTCVAEPGKGDRQPNARPGQHALGGAARPARPCADNHPPVTRILRILMADICQANISRTASTTMPCGYFYAQYRAAIHAFS